MRRHAIAIIGFCAGLLVLLALPESVSAQRSLPGAMVNAVSQPIGALLGTPNRSARRAYHRRSYARHHSSKRSAHIRRAAKTRFAKPATPSQTAPAAATAATAGGAAAAAITAQPEAVASHATSQPSTVASPAPRVATPGAASPSSAEPATTAAISSPAQPQDRSATTARAQPQAEDTSRGLRTSGRRSQPAAAPVVLQLGLTGPQSWPNAFEDVLGYTLWPQDYEHRLRAHGLGDLVAVIFRPAVAPAQVTRADTPRGRGSDTAGRPATGLCGDAPEPVDWPGRRLEQAGSLNDKQRAALGALRTAVTEAVKSIRTACREEVGLASPDRLISMQATLWAVRDASLLVRAPLQAFYDSLSDEQKAAFVVKQQPVPQEPAAADSRAERMRAAATARPEVAARLASASNVDMSAMMACGGESALEWSTDQIKRMVRPSAEQRASIEALQRSLMEMGGFLAQSCPQAPAETPMARLDSATDRLTAMIFAASTVGLALNDLYGLLTAEQKAHIAPPTQ